MRIKKITQKVQTVSTIMLILCRNFYWKINFFEMKFTFVFNRFYSITKSCKMRKVIITTHVG